jgi:hypothetical protein
MLFEHMVTFRISVWSRISIEMIIYQSSDGVKRVGVVA